MKRLQPLIACLLFALIWDVSLGLTPTQAATFDDAMKVAPHRGELFVGIDHTQLSQHQDREALVTLAIGQGLLPAIMNEKAACLESGKNVTRSIAVRQPGGGVLHILQGKFDKACTEDRLRGRLQGPLKKAKRDFTGEIAQRSFVAISGSQIALFLDTNHVLIGRPSHLKRVFTPGKKERRTAFNARGLRKLYRKANTSKALLWSFSKVPKRLKDRVKNTRDAPFTKVQNVVVSAVGTRGAKVEIRATMDRPSDADELKGLLNKRIQERLGSSMLLRAIGITAMVEQGLKLQTKGRVLVATITISPLQMGVLARSGGKILSILR